MDAQPTAPDSFTREARWQTLHAQLERMRAMHYKYSDLFYKLVTFAVVALILLAMASMTETLRASVLLIPFFIIYVGVQSAYFLTYVVLARVYATGIEQRINRLVGEDLLIAHRLEAAYLFPLKGPQFAGVPLRAEQTFVGFITIHFWLLGAAAIVIASYRALQLSRLSSFVEEFPLVEYYFPLLIAWSLFNLVYLVWYFGTRRHEQRIMQIVSNSYGTHYNEA
jgi:hypothetical protein